MFNSLVTSQLNPWKYAKIAPTLKRFYRAASLAKFNEPLAVVERKELKPHDGEMVVQVETAAMNYSDIEMIRGKYYLKPDLPFVPGFEAAGTVKAIGKGVKEFKEGDRVMMVKTNSRGAFAEECSVKEEDIVFHIPYSMDFETAASIGVSYGSAYAALQRMALERLGNFLLVLSSRGTTGFAAIDLAQNIFKYKVFAASDSEEKLARFREIGVISLFNYMDGQLTRNVKKMTMGHGVDLIIDTVGGDLFHAALNCLKPSGHLVSLGFSSGVPPTLNLLDLHRLQASVSGLWLGGRPRNEVMQIIDSLIRLFDEGFLSVRVGKTYPLDQINECIKDIDGDKVFGKVLIRMR